ncbi:putative disease resistance RPP13-like protein 1, partial [Sesamum alatum]
IVLGIPSSVALQEISVLWGLKNELKKIRQTSSLVNELEIYGRDEEKEMMMEKVLDSMRDQDDLSVYAIWGMWGMQRLVKHFIVSIEARCDISELDPLQWHLRQSLRGNKFLLILDYVWNENHELWDKLREVLRCGSKGSTLMVTTRIEKVALVRATVGVHQIGYLSEDDSWSLVMQRAFTYEDAEDNKSDKLKFAVDGSLPSLAVPNSIPLA